MSKMPPIPQEQRSHKGPGSDPAVEVEEKVPGREDFDTQGRHGNINHRSGLSAGSMMSNKSNAKISMRLTGLVLAPMLASASAGPASGQSGGGGSGGGAGGAGASAGAGGTSSGAATAPGTNSAGTAQSSGGGGPRGSTTVGRAGNPAGGTNIGRIDGTVTPGPSLQGDDQIRSESSQESEADRKIKSICRGC
ncbi:hypothetical protein AB7M16_003322 [Bradyrhizobium sp. USDA 372]